MTKNTKTVETTTEVKPEELAVEVVLQQKLDETQAELAAARTEIEDLTAQLAEAEGDKETLARELSELRQQGMLKPTAVKPYAYVRSKAKNCGVAVCCLLTNGK